MERVDLAGMLYGEFKTYKKLPMDDNENIQSEFWGAYIDSADEGSDYLCCISFILYMGLLYTLDVYYTQEAMEVTEKETAKRLLDNNIHYALFESNAGGRAFARNVTKEAEEIAPYNSLSIHWFHQSKNKDTRILSNSASVNNRVVMPVDWAVRWPVFHEHTTNHMKAGKNKHDHAPDTLTGCVEMLDKRIEFV